MTNPSVVPLKSWPASVPPVGHPRHVELLQKWCLEQTPATLRDFPVVNRHLPVLLLLTRTQLEGALFAARQAYSQMRSQLASHQAPETVAAALTATAAIGQELARSLDFAETMWNEHVEPQ